MSQLSELSGFEEEERPMPSIPLLPPLDVYQLRKCEHMMHHACLLMYMKNSSNVSAQSSVLHGTLFLAHMLRTLPVDLSVYVFGDNFLVSSSYLLVRLLQGGGEREDKVYFMCACVVDCIPLPCGRLYGLYTE